jgi:hypothetical protein
MSSKIRGAARGESLAVHWGWSGTGRGRSARCALLEEAPQRRQLIIILTENRAAHGLRMPSATLFPIQDFSHLKLRKPWGSANELFGRRVCEVAQRPVALHKAELANRGIFRATYMKNREKLKCRSLQTSPGDRKRQSVNPATWFQSRRTRTGCSPVLRMRPWNPTLVRSWPRKRSS